MVHRGVSPCRSSRHLSCVLVLVFGQRIHTSNFRSILRRSLRAQHASLQCKPHARVHAYVYLHHIISNHLLPYHSIAYQLIAYHSISYIHTYLPTYICVYIYIYIDIDIYHIYICICIYHTIPYHIIYHHIIPFPYIRTYICIHTYFVAFALSSPGI